MRPFKLIFVIFAVFVVNSQQPQAAASASPQRANQPAPTGLVLGQVVDADSGKGVSGAIVTLGASAPVASVIAELVDIGATPAATGRRMMTGSDGRFLFRDLPAGRYALSTTAPGYVPAAYGQGRPAGPGQPIDLDDAQKLGDVKVRVWKFATISGTVVDEHGDAAVGISMRCMRRLIAGGRQRFGTAFTATSDDRGMYRVANLVPGAYVCGTVANQTTVPMSAVAASAEANQRGNPNASEAYRTLQASGASLLDPSGMHIGDLVLRPSGIGIMATARGLLPPAPAADGRMMMYPTLYYAAATTTTQASIVTLKSGEDRVGIDVQLKLVAAVRVAGTVLGPNGPAANFGMTLVPTSGTDIVSEGQAEAASTVTDGSGRFTFLGIPSGQYMLKIRMYPRAVAAPAATTTVEGVPAAAVDIGLMAPGAGLLGRGGAPPPPPPAEPTLWAAMPVTVGDADILDLAVTLRPGVKVTGRIEFVGSKAQPTADQIQRVAIRLQSAEGRTSSPIAAEGRAAADGAFRTAGYPTGRYIASVVPATLPAGWTLKSIVSGGRDVSVEPLELSDADITGVVIICTDQTTTLSGTVMGTSGADANAEVIAFPADSVAWKDIGVVARRSRNERATKTGAFSIAGLPPGEYFIAAVATGTVGDWQDPVFLDTLVRVATRVTLVDGEKKTVTLTVRRPGL